MARINAFLINSLALLFSLTLHASDGYIGSQQCAACHSDEYQQWQGSQHQQAMMKADESTMQADFDGVERSLGEVVIKPYIEGDSYWLAETDAEGKLSRHKIDYTFGVYPLQQFMVSFDDGRVQLLPYTWDSRSEAEGGQRWYDLYPDFKTADHQFHWLNTGQNWNSMCADCHSTNLQKNFDITTNTYDTDYAEISVGCEACHGPGEEHRQWANAGAKGDDSSLNNIASQIVEYEPTPKVLMPKTLQHSDQVETCAQCHARRNQLNDDNSHLSTGFDSRYRLSLLEPSLYYPDGQIYDEDYVYGSFIQSKMHQQGVTCSNCHNPHTAELKFDINQTCTQCHNAAEYSARKHTMHPVLVTAEAGKGSACVDCHMPQTRYMEVDDRRDHSFTIPRPDLSLTTGAPNACSSCHEDKDDQWALAKMQQHYPNSTLIGSEHFSVAFSRADSGIDSGQSLAKIAQDQNYPAIIRGSALLRMQNYNDPNTIISLKRGVESEQTLVRAGAIAGARQMPIESRWRLLNGLLEDQHLSIRTEAATALSEYMPKLAAADQQRLKKALDEYIDVQLFNGDRGGSHFNIGLSYLNLAEYKKAEQAFKESIRIEPSSDLAYVALADMKRQLNRPEQELSVLDQGVRAAPNSGGLLHARGLYYVRAKQLPLALADLQQATVKSPENPRYQYILAVALMNEDAEQATTAFTKAWQLNPNDLQTLFALTDFLIKQGDKAQAGYYLKALKQRAPKGAPWLGQLEQAYRQLP
ncbi:hypothetical protein SIN8267_03114 [Sinobacterium norvegicum]|uniref:Cytochrome c-552/4 domain-containing protein n=1 Tax=Sinobacterium norvegicum TaxID=1641715 RepID=A0ABN8EKP2_9GAMM|nr:multiheme c-type cytochrome [Sinobacterium norvegicum]CAH0992975.1 hypothetical protein SIN8267_03114 [Sinobacterium norvegicum]